ncbi:hypothetical protein K438DRAFT_2128617 [Mycena galopus ATCC 62051]|nr:hypothetical protein K438DRAFT_2128617 [Mycena galopus ATCC 62051]
MDLIYLAQLTNRVPIIPRFRPVHIDGHDIDFSDIFDLPRLQKEVGIPILEWREVKFNNLGCKPGHRKQDIGCWDVQFMTWDGGYSQHHLEPPADVKLDISYTRIPRYVRTSLEMDKPTDGLGVFMWPLASLISYTPRLAEMEHLPTPRPSPLHQLSLAPNDHLVCATVCTSGSNVCLAWEMMGRATYALHGRGAEDRCGVHASDAGGRGCRRHSAVEFPVQLLYLADAERSQYIAVHVRHGDFSMFGGGEDCFAPLSAYEDRVNQVRAEVMKDSGVDVTRGIITSDETDPAWSSDGPV